MTKISNQSEFFIFLLEKYAEYKSLPANEILKLWQERGLMNYLNGMYEQYHTERLENAFADIDRKMEIIRESKIKKTHYTELAVYLR
jgi:hypothetical protein